MAAEWNYSQRCQLAMSILQRTFAAFMSFIPGALIFHFIESASGVVIDFPLVIVVFVLYRV